MLTYRENLHLDSFVHDVNGSEILGLAVLEFSCENLDSPKPQQVAIPQFSVYLPELHSVSILQKIRIFFGGK